MEIEESVLRIVGNIHQLFSIQLFAIKAMRPTPTHERNAEKHYVSSCLMDQKRKASNELPRDES